MEEFTSDEQLDNWFTFHPATPEIAEMHGKIRAAAREFARNIQAVVPEGPDKTTAFRAVQLAMWAGNAALACSPFGDRNSNMQYKKWFKANVDLDRIIAVRSAAESMADVYHETLASGPDKTLAIREVQKALWASIAAITCNS